MSDQSITCLGADLSQVLADITARGGRTEAMDCCGTAGYKVYYFQESKSVTDASALIFPHQCETPATPAAPEAVKSTVAPRSSLNGVKIPCQTPASGSMSLQQFRIVPSLVCGENKVGVAPSSLGGANPATQGRRDAPPLARCGVCSGETAPGKPCAICDALGRIRASARRLRNRFRTGVARLPHPND